MNRTNSSPTDGQHRQGCPDQTDMSELRCAGEFGGLVIIGHAPGPLTGIDVLLDAPATEGIEGTVDELSDWATASRAVAQMTRQASAAVRAGKTAVVYLDSHLDHVGSTTMGTHDFACDRLGSVAIGLADAPAYVGLHGRKLAQTVLAGNIGEDATIGQITDGLPVVKMGRLFPGTPVAMASEADDVTAMVDALDWFESRRS